MASGGGGQEETTIGLKRHTVRVVAYRDEWRGLFERELRALQERIGHLVVDVQHVDSTEMPGLDAKPIIDIAVAVPSAKDIPRLRRPLGDAGANGGHLFVKESAPDVRPHHLHVVAEDNPQWREWLLFRDKLQADEKLRARYAQTEKALQERFAEDRKGYTSAKNQFIRGLLYRRCEWGRFDPRTHRTSENPLSMRSGDVPSFFPGPTKRRFLSNNRDEVRLLAPVPDLGVGSHRVLHHPARL